MDKLQIHYDPAPPRIIPLNTCVIDEYDSGIEGVQPVAVVIAGSDAPSLQNAKAIIKAAPTLYRALENLVAEIRRNDTSGTAGDLEVVARAEDALDQVRQVRQAHVVRARLSK